MLNLIPSTKNLVLMFLIFCFIIILIMLVTDIFLISDELYYNSFSDLYTIDIIEDIVKNNHKWSSFGYLIVPILSFIKFTLVAACISTGLYFQENRFRFKEAFGLAIWAEGVFIVVSVVMLLWFLFIQTNYTLQDLQFFFPLSTLNLFDFKHLESYLVYPLQVLNLFEIAYWFVLAYGIKKMLGSSWERGMTVVASSYGVGLVIWVVFVVFLTINLS